MRVTDSAGLVWVLVGSVGSMDLGMEQESVVHWWDVRVGQDVGWSLHVRMRRGKWGHDHTIAWRGKKKKLIN